ncbi:hypothetical protein C8Q77DRAFT_1076648 [Trametes polyzona]|nr:hypothetical protein C8Q77DRAFT_1076648 [Trametes polyzona]
MSCIPISHPVRPGVPVSSPRRELQPPTAASRFADVARHIVAAMPKPDFSPFSETAPCESRCDLLSLLKSSKVFFPSAAEVLWECPTNIQAVLRLLLMGSPGAAFSLNWLNAQDAEQYMFGHISHLIASHNGDTDPVLNRFQFYANFVVRLRVVATEAYPCLSSKSLNTFLYCSHISILTLRLQDQPSVAPTTQGRESFARAVVELLSDVSLIVPELRKLTIHAPSAVPIPASAVLCFSSLRHANLHVCISEECRPDVELEPINVDSLQTLEVHWTHNTHLTTITDVVGSSQLRELTVMAYQHLGQLFLYDMYLLTACTASDLTRLKIYALGDTFPPAEGGQFLNIFKPLLARRSLQHVAIVLSGYRTEFSPHDLFILAQALPDLHHLNLSFTLHDYSMLPTLAYTIRRMYELCPKLEFLHVPALASALSHGPFHLPCFPDSALEYISSDVSLFEHKALDMAWSLHVALPRLQQTGPFDSGDQWRDTNTLIQALKKADYTVVFEHVARYSRAGAYRRPPASLLLVLLDALQGRDTS